MSDRAFLMEDGSVAFECPGCGSLHRIIPGRWEWNNRLDRPTFSPSVLVTWTYGDSREERRCHSYVRDGQIQFLSDCTHALAGQTVDLPEVGFPILVSAPEVRP